MAADTPYVSDSDLAEYLKMDAPAETSGEDTLTRAVAAATRWINNHCGRSFNLDDTATARYFDALTNGTVLVDDIGSVTDLVIATDSSHDGTYATTWTGSDYQLNPLAATAAGEPFTSVRPVGSLMFPPSIRREGMVRVTAMWGWPAVPSDVKLACLIQAARLFKRHESPQGVLGGGEFGVVRVGTIIDPDVKMLLAPYRYVSI